MNRNLIIVFVLLVFISCARKSQNQQNSDMISLEKIQEMYKSMHNNGVDTDKDMLYGYFFTNSEPNKLEKVSEYLKTEGFKYVDIYPDDTGEYWLHIERIETHNANSLFNLNTKLYKVAKQFKITSYDGFDVGNIDKNKPIERDTYVVPEKFEANDFIKQEKPFFIVANKAFEQFPHKEEFLYFIKIKTKYPVNDISKLPTEEEFEVLNDFEIFIENNLTKNKISNYYVARMTYDSERVFYLVTNEKEGAKRLIEFIKVNGKQREFDYQIIEDKEWKTYSELIGNLK